MRISTFFDKIKHMSKKTLTTVIISSLLIVASLIVLLVFFVVKKDDAKAENLQIQAEDIVLYIGQEKNDFYSVSNANASVAFVYDKDGIIEVINGAIIALDRGVQEFTIVATLSGQSTSKTIRVTVRSLDYDYEITDLVGGVLQDDIIYLNSNVCQFQIILYDMVGQKVEGQHFEYLISSGKISYDMAFLVEADQDCQVKIIYPNLDFEIVIEIKI